jgi:hypothetical protein
MRTLPEPASRSTHHSQYSSSGPRPGDLVSQLGRRARNGRQHPFPKPGGERYVPSTSLTKYCQLRKWIRKFNSGLKQEELTKYSISEGISANVLAPSQETDSAARNTAYCDENGR